MVTTPPDETERGGGDRRDAMVVCMDESTPVRDQTKR